MRTTHQLTPAATAHQAPTSATHIYRLARRAALFAELTPLNARRNKASHRK